MRRRILACCVALLSACGRVDFELARLSAAPDAGLPTDDPTSSVPDSDSRNDSETATRGPTSSDASDATSSDVDSTSLQSDVDSTSLRSDVSATSLQSSNTAATTLATDATGDGTLNGSSTTGAPPQDSSQSTSEATLSTSSAPTSDDSGGPATSTDASTDTATAGPDSSASDSNTSDSNASESTSLETTTTDATSGPEPACTAGTSQYPTVQSVLDDAACPTVYVPAQTFVEDVNVARDVRIEGVSSATSVLEGTGGGSVATIGAGLDVEFTSLTVRGGAGSLGGGITSLANLTLSDVVVTDNHVSGVDARGGGVYQQGGTLDLLSTAISGNSAALSGGAGMARGGGLFATGAQVAANGVVFDANQLQCGGDGVDCHLEGAGGYLASSAVFTSTGSGVAFTGNVIDFVELDPYLTLSANGAGLACTAASVQLQSGADSITGNSLTLETGRSSGDAKGGGLFASNCGVQLSGADVSGNTITSTSEQQYATGMGAGMALTSAVLAWSNSTCVANSVQAEVPVGSPWPAIARGGCASVEESTASITSSTFSGNRAEALGGDGVVWADAGALLFQASTTNAVATILGCSFGPNNEATSTADEPGASQRSCGGAVSVWVLGAGEQEVLMTSTTVSGNRVEANAAGAFAEGAGIDVAGDNSGISHIEMSSVTLAANTVTGALGGGGLHVRSDGSAQASATLRNTILADTTGGNDCDGASASVELEGNNLIEATNCAFTGPGNAVAADPELGAIGDNGGSVLTCSLSSTSPARNAGPVMGCMDELGYEVAVDARGLSRVGVCDLGAFEAQADE